MASLTSQLIVRLIDGVSGPARRAATALRSLNNAAHGGGGAAIANMQDRLGAAVKRNNRAIGVLQGRLTGAAVAGYGLHRSLTPTIDTAMDFETTLEDIGQKADITGDKLKNVGKRIREIGKATNQSTQGVGRGVDFLLGMGLGGKTDEENLDNALDMSPAIGKTATAYRAEFEEIARASHAVFQNMKVPAEQIQLALDGMAKAGKLGGYELKDMAKDFPAITASAQFLGSKGVEGVADLAAALQVARKGARDGSQAANNLANFLQKFTLKETVKNFENFGVDIYKELDKAREMGISPIEHMMDVLKKVTKGDGDLVSAIFGDKQVLEFIRPMWDNMDEYRRVRTQALAAQGEVEADFARRVETSEAKWNNFTNTLERFRITVGNTLLPGFTKLIGGLGDLTEAVEGFAERNPELTAGVVGLAAGLVGLGIAAVGISLAARLAKGGLLAVAGAGLKLAKPFAFLAGGIASRALGFFQTLGMRAKLAGNPGAMARIADFFVLLGKSARNLLRPTTLLRGLMGALGSIGPMGWAAAAGIGLLALAANNLEGISAFAGGFWDKFTEGLAPLQGTLAPVSDAIGRFANYLIDITGFDTGKMREIGESFGSFSAGALVATIQSVVSAFGWVIEKAQAAASAVAGFFSQAAAGPGTPSPTGKMPSGARGAPPGRSRGGRVSRGSSYLVGERRPEIFTPGQSGYITPRTPDGGGGGRAAGGGPVSVTVNIDGAGDPQAVADKVMAQLERRVNDLFRGVQADARTGFGY